MCCREPDKVVPAIDKSSGFPVDRPMPDALALHMRIKPKHGRRWRRWRVAQIDAIAVNLAAKPEFQTCDFSVCESLHRISSLTNAASDSLRACPKGRSQAT